MSKPYASFGFQKSTVHVQSGSAPPPPGLVSILVYTPFFFQFLVLFLHGYKWRSLFFVIVSSIIVFPTSGTLDCPLFDAWPMAFSASKDSYNGPLVFTFCINPLFVLEVHIYCNQSTYKATCIFISKIQCNAILPWGATKVSLLVAPFFS